MEVETGENKMKKNKLGKNSEVSERMKYKIEETTQYLIDCYRRLSEFGITDSRGYLSYSKAMRKIYSMHDNKGKSELVELFNSARGARRDTLDEMTTDTMNKLHITRRRSYVKIGENNEYRG